MAKLRTLSDIQEDLSAFDREEAETKEHIESVCEVGQLESKLLIEYVLKWREDPVTFVKEFFGASPSKQQEEAIRAFAKPGSRVAIKSGHGTGKSAIMSWLVLWSLVCFEDVKCPVTAPTAHQLKDVLMSEVRKWVQNAPEPWKSSLKVTDDEIRFEGCMGFAACRTGRKENPEALQGFHAENLMFFVDEASGVPDVVFQVAQGALSTPGARVLMAANPTRSSGYFYNTFHKDRDKWTRLTFSCIDSPNVSREYIKEIADEYGENSDIYRVRVLGEFPSSGDMQFISTDLVNKAMGKHLSEDMYSFAPRILGVDVARSPTGDESVIALRQGLRSEILWHKRGSSLMELADLVVAFSRQYRADAMMIDTTGIGTGVVDRLVQLGYSPIAVNFGGASGLRNCSNKRAEIWWRMKEWLESGGALPNNEDLRDDLIGPEFQYNAKGLVQLERKEDMKKRGLSSPDLADAIAVTFAAQVQSRNDMMYNALKYAETKKAYDPLEL